MKRLGIVFWGMLCMILLIACFHPSDRPTPVIPEKPEKGVTFEWDAVTSYTNGKRIGENDVKVKYVVYVYRAENIDEQPHDDLKIVKYKDCIEIEKTSCKIKFDDKDKGLNFFLGVQALLYKGVSKGGNPIIASSSTISWSSSKTLTNNKPQYVHVSK